jgi:hypothetical protein
LLWKLWSPHWGFADATFERSARSFDNPDFVAVTIQSYRHRYGYAPGDPAVEAIEQRLAPQPQIAVPTIALQGEADGVHPPQASAHHGRFFAGQFERRVLPKSGTIPRGKRQRPLRMQFLNYSKARPDNLLLPPSIRSGSTTPCGLPTDIVRGMLMPWDATLPSKRR